MDENSFSYFSTHQHTSTSEQQQHPQSIGVKLHRALVLLLQLGQGQLLHQRPRHRPTSRLHIPDVQESLFHSVKSKLQDQDGHVMHTAFHSQWTEKVQSPWGHSYDCQVVNYTGWQFTNTDWQHFKNHGGWEIRWNYRECQRARSCIYR